MDSKTTPRRPPSWGPAKASATGTRFHQACSTCSPRRTPASSVGTAPTAEAGAAHPAGRPRPDASRGGHTGTLSQLIAPAGRGRGYGTDDSEPSSDSDGPPPLVDDSCDSDSDDPSTIAAIREIGRASLARAAEIRAEPATAQGGLARVFASRPWAEEEGRRLHQALARGSRPNEESSTGPTPDRPRTDHRTDPPPPGLLRLASCWCPLGPLLASSWPPPAIEYTLNTL
jgi:hypothetical protein